MPGISASFPWVGQQYIAGRAYCTYSIVQQGAVVAHACYAGTFTAGRGASISFEREERGDLLEWVTRFAAAVRFTGQIAFDFIVTAEGKAYPIECNPRATSGVHLFRPADRLERAFFGEGLETGEVVQPSDRRPSLLAAAMLAYGWRSGGESGEAERSGAGKTDRPEEQPSLSQRSDGISEAASQSDMDEAARRGADEANRLEAVPSGSQRRGEASVGTGRSAAYAVERTEALPSLSLRGDAAPDETERAETPSSLPQRSGAAPGSRAATDSRSKHRSRFRQWASLMRRGRDVVFRLDDPLPAAAQLAVLWHFWRRSRSRRISIAEAMTSDIEWNGEAWQ